MNPAHPEKKALHLSSLWRQVVLHRKIHGLDLYVLQESQGGLAQKGKERVATVLAKQVDRGKMSADMRESILVHITPVGGTLCMLVSTVCRSETFAPSREIVSRFPVPGLPAA